MRIATDGKVVSGLKIARPRQGLLGEETGRSEELAHGGGLEIVCVGEILRKEELNVS
jgi:hypothetical protein